MMKDGSKVVGIGCFAGRATLLRVFRKALENFILGKYDDTYPAADLILKGEKVTQFFRSAIQSGKKKPDQIDQASEFLSAAAKLTGFYLGLNKQSLHLNVFFQGAGHQQTKFTTRLEKFTRLRNKRLH
jgi:hypothetical protein